jgi:hypothetical protein
MEDNLPKGAELAPFCITTKQAVRRYGVSARTLANWRAAGMACLMPGRRKTLYVVSDSDAWVRARFAVGRPKPTLARIARAASAGGAQ